MRFIGAEQVNQLLVPIQLVNKLAIGFASHIVTPKRQHFDIPNPFSSRENTLLMMPSWQQGQDIGIKLVTVTPESHKYNLPSIQGMYVLFDAVKGNVKALIDAPALTAKRTAAASALASRFLSRPDSKTLFMIGTGTLAPELIRAHCAVRPIEHVLIWGRNANKAKHLIAELTDIDALVEMVESIPEGLASADIVSCATLSQQPLIMGKWLRQGQHIDLVGAYRPDMREADDSCMQRSIIFVDNVESAIKETGDLALPLQTGVLSIEDIQADLFDLCRKTHLLERKASDITLFKSVGHALEDLAAAQLIIENLDTNI